ncbi:MAG: HlyC/CorC family transporter [Firmicutes bacterium]|nr:HlyC/CorC family transporter [Bacillota bacterium]MBR6584451.1 HlyC/CorC family transporter [Bacillota bacterium]
MSNDLGSDPLQTGLVLGLIVLHGVFVLINSALEEEGRNSEKIGSTNKLLILLCAVFGGWFAFTGWIEMVLYFVLLVAFGQYFPRKIALQHSDSIAEKTEPFAKGIAAVLTPVTWILMFMANMLLKIFRQETIVSDGEFSEEEVMSMLEVGQETGIIKEEGKKMINSIFAFDDKLAYEVMTPRTDVFLIDIEDPLEEYIEDLMTLRHSRIPVCEGETDNIIGILNIKDYLRKVHEEGGEEDIEIKEILRKAYFVPETKNIDTLFFELQKTKQQIAILIDEYGGFSGIVTMEDIIEQVMGNIEDEYDEEEEIIDKVDDNIYLVDGDVSLDDLNEEIGVELISENSETIGGFIIDILGEIPDESDEGRIVEFENYQFKIMAIRERRIERVKIYVLDPEAAETDDEEQSETDD